MLEQPDFLSDDSKDDEAFWPSFADIMMVITIIFLLMMVVMVIKNWELVEKLRFSVLAEQKTQQEMLERTEENQKLSDRLSDSEEELLRLKMELLEKSEEYNLLELVANEKSVTITQLEQSLVKKDFEYNQINSELENERSKQNQLTLALTSANEQIEEKNKTIAQLTDSTQSLREEFQTLNKKYQKLIRPARTTKGKHVVQITYTRNGRHPKIQIQLPKRKKMTVTRTRLETILTKLKKEHPNKLYLKIVFPEDRTISHSEAWKFTTSLLRKYDYYYQNSD